MASQRLHLPQPVSLVFRHFFRYSFLQRNTRSLNFLMIFSRSFGFQPSTQHITHVYHTADPIAMGTCNGILSSCALAGYALESRYVRPLFSNSLLYLRLNRCHLGKSIIYDTISNLSWASDIRTHTIQTVIDRLLAEPWAPAVEQGREVPKPQMEEDCVVRNCDP